MSGRSDQILVINQNVEQDKADGGEVSTLTETFFRLLHQVGYSTQQAQEALTSLLVSGKVRIYCKEKLHRLSLKDPENLISAEEAEKLINDILNLEQKFSSTTQESFADRLQLICFEGNTGELCLTSPSGTGRVFFCNGDLIHAATDQSEGNEALFEMLQWEEGTSTFEDSSKTPRRTVFEKIDALLLEAARRTDNPDYQKKTGEGSAKFPRLPSSFTATLPKMTIMQPDHPPKTIELVQDILHIGRHPMNDLVFEDAGLSGRHCLLTVNGATVSLRDLNSTNGTYVNGQPVTETTLQVGDILQIGSISIRIESKPKRPKIQNLSKIYDTSVITLRKKNQAERQKSLQMENPIRIHAESNPPTATTKRYWSWILAALIILVFIGAILMVFLKNR